MSALVVDYVIPDRLCEVSASERRRPPMPPMSIGLLKAMTPATLDGHELAARCWDEQSMGRYDVSLQRPDILCLSSLTPSAARAYQIATESRDSDGASGQPIKVAMGGIHATALPHEALHYVDAVCVGETPPSLLKRLLGWLIEQRQTRSCEKRAFVYQPETGDRQLEARPLPDWSWVPDRGYLVPWSMQTSVGCPFDCSFCSTTFMYGSALRHLPYDIIEQDAQRVARVGGMGTVIDDNFLPNKYGAHARMVCEIFRRHGVKWASELTALTLYNNWKEIIPTFARSGCRGLFLGLETLFGRMAKSTDVRNYEDLVKRLHDNGIAVLGAFVFGVSPEDGPDVFEKTVEWGIRNRLDLAQFSINTPEPGARDYEDAVRNGLITDWNWEHYDCERPVRTFTGISQEAMYDGLRNAYRWFYNAGSAWKRLAPNLRDLAAIRYLRRPVFLAAANSYLNGTARGWNNRSSYTEFEKNRVTEPNRLVLEQFAEGMPVGQYDVKERNRVLLRKAPNPLQIILPGVKIVTEGVKAGG